MRQLIENEWVEESVMYASGGTCLVVTVYSYVRQLGCRGTLCTPWSNTFKNHVNHPPLEKREEQLKMQTVH